MDSSRRDFDIIGYPKREKMKLYPNFTNTKPVNFRYIKNVHGCERCTEGGTGKHLYDLP